MNPRFPEIKRSVPCYRNGGLTPVLQKKEEGWDDFADEVVDEISNRGTGAEAGEFQARIRSFPPMWEIMNPDQGCSEKRAEHLCREIRQELGEVTGADRKTHRDRRI